MMARRLLSSLAVATGIVLVGCKSATRESHDGAYAVTIDLNKVAPIGYEVCADRPPRLSRANLDLRIQLPSRIEIPPSQQNYGAKYVEFKPGQHEVDVYRDLHSARLLFTRGSLIVENNVPTVRVKLQMAKLPEGRYILGVSGDPFFAYCTVDLR